MTTMGLLGQLLKRTPEPLEEGPLFSDVRLAMGDVQAYARSHGGNIDLIGVSDEGDVRIRFTGTCRICPMSELTLKLGVEDRLKELVPGVRKIIRVK